MKDQMDECRKWPVGMAYVPWQYFDRSYEPQHALKTGTIFPELDKPFVGRRGGDLK